MDINTDWEDDNATRYDVDSLEILLVIMMVVLDYLMKL